MKNERRNRLTILLALGLLLASLTGCCCVPPQEAVDLIEDAIAVNAGHMADPHDELPSEAKEIARDNHDAWQQVRYALTGEQVDPDVAARRNARRGGP